MGSCYTQRSVIAVLIALGSADGAQALCSDATVELRSGDALARFSIEIADTQGERAQGLMNRDNLASAAGMLFVYDTPGRASFWMKETLIPLDMIFVDQTGRVTQVAQMAKPGDLTPIDGGDDVAMVLEINGGLAKRLGIEPGSVLRHPAVDQVNAVWPCADE